MPWICSHGSWRAAGLGFYEVAAQVLPVLMLVLAFELHTFRLLDTPAYFKPALRWFSAIPEAVFALPTRSLPVLALFVMLAGELAALNTIASGDPPSVTRGIVGFALTLGLVAIAAAALTSRHRRHDLQRET